MKHVNINTQDESVKRFVLALSVEPDGSVLEVDGRAVAHVLPVQDESGTANGSDWDEVKNTRRCVLIDREIAGTLTEAQVVELRILQQQMLQHRRRVAPLPIEDARALHQQLLERARPSSGS